MSHLTQMPSASADSPHHSDSASPRRIRLGRRQAAATIAIAATVLGTLTLAATPAAAATPSESTAYSQSMGTKLPLNPTCQPYHVNYVYCTQTFTSNGWLNGADLGLLADLVDVTAVGGHGGASSAGTPGGDGGKVTGQLLRTNTKAIQIVVGTNGASGSAGGAGGTPDGGKVGTGAFGGGNGGGGGGATIVDTSAGNTPSAAATAEVVAPGGGGAADGSPGGQPGGPAGNAWDGQAGSNIWHSGAGGSGDTDGDGATDGTGGNGATPYTGCTGYACLVSGATEYWGAGGGGGGVYGGGGGAGLSVTQANSWNWGNWEYLFTGSTKLPAGAGGAGYGTSAATVSTASPQVTLGWAPDVQATTTTVAVTRPVVQPGDMTIATATVAVPGAGFAATNGSVQFMVDGAAYGSPIAVSGGKAAIVLHSLGVGAHTVTAHYTSKFYWGASTSAAAPYDVSTTWSSYDDTDNSFVYSGNSWQATNNRGFGDLGDDLHGATSNGDETQFSFTGTDAVILGEKYSDEAQFAVYLDGAYVTTVNPYSTTRLADQPLYTVSGLPMGSHKILLKHTGTNGQWLTIDGARVLDTANLLTDGGFEQPTLATAWILAGSVPGWTEAHGNPIEIDNAADAAEGNQYVEIDGAQSDSISQSFATVPGKTYTVTFRYSARAGTGSNENAITIAINGATVASRSLNGVENTRNVWQTYTRTFTATATTSSLTITDAGISDGIGMHIDDAQAIAMGY